MYKISTRILYDCIKYSILWSNLWRQHLLCFKLWYG